MKTGKPAFAKIIFLVLVITVSSFVYGIPYNTYAISIDADSNSTYEEWLDKSIEICRQNAPAYFEQYWNWQSWLVKSTNCYAYAFDMTKNPLTGKAFEENLGLQPGLLSGLLQIPDLFSGSPRSNRFLIHLISCDMEASGYSFAEAEPGAAIPAGSYMVALALYPGDALNESDYHWYRLNPDGTWSHKPGFYPVTNLDNSGNLITDPFTADRGKYYAFVGYFYVSNEN